MPKLRVLVVDDAVVMRRMITEALSSDPEIEVAGIASNGKLALARIPQLAPDVITLDIEMPEMDGLEALREIRKLYPKLPVIMFSTLTKRAADVTLDALARGANDYVTKPSNVGDVREGIRRLQDELIPKIKLHCRPASHAPAVQTSIRKATPFQRSDPGAHAVHAIAIGTSTGGPNALAEIFAQWKITPETPPIFIVQHMPPVFTDLLAERLRKVSGAPIHEATDGQIVRPGHGYLAPGGRHLEVQRQGNELVTALHSGPPENSCRPAVDVLFRSLAASCGSHVIAAVLTGMGQDGLRGSQHLHEAGSHIYAQDAATSVVWGMPGAVAGAHLAEAILPVGEFAPLFNRITRAGLAAPSLAH